MSIYKNQNGVAVKKSGSSPNYNRNFAPVENSSTSSAAYSIGDLLIVGNRLVKAKTAIAIGDTFSLNQNIELTDVATEIENGGSGSGGHTIENSSGTDLTQRDTLKFAGTLKATDDSTNEKTVISDAAEEVEWSVWNAMTEAQRDAYSAGKKLDIVNVPGADGTISADVMKLLWTNPSPSASFAAQTISLDLSEYDFILIDCKTSTSDATMHSFYIDKELSPFRMECIVHNATLLAYSRNVSFSDDYTQVVFTAGYGNGSATGTGSVVIPIKIYGIKKTISLKINAIASDVSTSASKCMMSDGETSVEDTFSYSTEETVTGKTWIDGKPIYRKVISIPSFPNSGSSSTPTGVSNVDYVVKLTGMTRHPTKLFLEGNWFDGTHRMRYYYSGETNSIIIDSSFDSSGYTGFIIFEYTKTTD